MTSRVLPAGWIQVALGDCCHIVQGQSPPGDTYNSDGLGLPFYQGKAEFGDLFPTPVKWCTADGKVAMSDDVLISVRAPVGPTNLCQKKSVIGRGLAAIRPLGGIDSRYVLYSIRNSEGELASRATGSTFASISGDTLRGHFIPLAPLAEQRRIVAEIETQLTRLDAAAEALKRAQANLKRYRAAVLKAAVEGRLKPNETGLIGKTETEIENHDTWNWTTLPDIGELGRGKSTHRPRNDPRLLGGNHPFIQTGDIRNSGGRIRSHSQTYSDFGLAQSKLWPSGTLCITIAANIAETGILTFPACFPDSVVGFVYHGDQVTVRFIEFYFRTIKDEVERNASATAQKNINLSTLSTLRIPLPPLAEQHRIVADVERRLSVVEEMEKTIVHGLLRVRAERLRQAILRKAFSGELVPQDPKDEPASVLLERIRAERMAQQPVKKAGRGAKKAVQPRLIEG